MIYELKKEDYEKVRVLFSEYTYTTTVFSHIEGNLSDTIFVDNIDDPKTAVIWHKWKYYAGGNPTNENFNSALRKKIYEEIAPEVEKEKVYECVFLYPNKEWERSIYQILRKPIERKRRAYKIDKLEDPNWRNSIPKDHKIAPIDTNLLRKIENKEILNFEWLMDELELMWLTLEHALKTVRGFYLLNENNEVVSWCTFEYPTKDNKTEVAISTDSNYRRRGYAFLVGNATAEYALKHYDSIGWQCSEGNIGSIKTAEKIGFTHITSYVELNAWYNPVDNNMVQAFSYFRAENYVKVIDTYSKVFKEREENSREYRESYLIHEYNDLPYIYFHLGVANSHIVDQEKAFQFFEKSINNGFKHFDRFEESDRLEEFRKSDYWEKLEDMVEKAKN